MFFHGQWTSGSKKIKRLALSILSTKICLVSSVSNQSSCGTPVGFFWGWEHSLEINFWQPFLVVPSCEKAWSELHTREEGVSKEKCALLMSRASFCKTQANSLLPFFHLSIASGRSCSASTPFYSQHARYPNVPIKSVLINKSVYRICLIRSRGY